MPVAAILPLLILLVAFDGFCLYDLARTRVRFLPKWLWAVVIVFFTLGGVVYLAVGREHA